MWWSIVVLACLAFIGVGRRVQNLAQSVHHSQNPYRVEANSGANGTHSADLRDGSTLLLAHAPAATFHRSIARLRRPSQSPNLMKIHSSAHSADLRDGTQSIGSSLLLPHAPAVTLNPFIPRFPRSAGMPSQSSLGSPIIPEREDQSMTLPIRQRSSPVKMSVTIPSEPIASLAIFGVANAAGFFITAVTGWHYHLDLIGTGVFAVFAWMLRGTALVQMSSAGAIGLWATRLASFLFFRVLQTKTDARLLTTLSKTSGQFGFWFISFLWGLLVSLPHTLAATMPSSEQPEFGVVHALGLVMFAVGFLIEAGADYQKWMFKGNVANKGKFCDVGVWRLCQHPNWFGNLLLWSGIFIVNAPSLLARRQADVALSIGSYIFPIWVNGFLRFLTASISPLFLLWLFSGQANGRPPLNKGFDLMQERFGKDKAFLAYDACTPRFVPTFKSINASHLNERWSSLQVLKSIKACFFRK